MEVNDVVVGILFTVLGGILKHIYGKFEKIDNVNTEQDAKISKIDGQINLLIAHNEQRQIDVNEIKKDVKETNEKVTKIMVKVGA
jgi:hypothetical protein